MSIKSQIERLERQMRNEVEQTILRLIFESDATPEEVEAITEERAKAWHWPVVGVVIDKEAVDAHRRRHGMEAK